MIVVLLLAACAPKATAVPVEPVVETESAVTSEPAATEPAVAASKGQIGIVFGDLNNPVFTFMKEQMEAKATELGYDPIVLDSQGSSETELANVENLISKGVVAICLLSVNADSSLQTVKKANEAGIPIVGWNRFVDTQDVAKYTTQVVTDNVPGAVDAGKLAVELLKDEQDPKVVILRGLSGIDADIDRVDGFLEGIKGTPLENAVVAIQRADFARQKGYEVMSDILQAESKIDLVYAVNDESAIGAYQAIKEAGREGIMVIGYDGSKEYVELIKEGKVTATIAQMFATLGTTAVDYAIQAAEGTLSGVDPVVYIGTEVITQDNAATYIFK